MIALLQRVTSARVDVGGETTAAIGGGLLVFACVERGDDAATVARMAERVCGYRIFADEAGRMNLSVADAGGDLLVVPQFTLAADTRKGMRPGFSSAGDPAAGRALFDAFVHDCAASLGREIPTGRFGADMQVSLTNDGPATFWLQTPTRRER